MSKISVGDRVRVYGIVHEDNCYARTGEIERIISGVSTANGFDRVCVDLDEPIIGKRNPIIVYLRQCRKLTPKKKCREIWIHKNELDSRSLLGNEPTQAVLEHFVKFREVKEK